MMTNLLSSSVARLRFLLVMLVMMFATAEMWGAEVLSETFTFNSTDGIQELGLEIPADGKGTNLDNNETYSKGLVSMIVSHGSTNTRIWNSKGTYDLRVYSGGGKLTFSVPSGYQITAIRNTGTQSNITVNVGTYSSGNWTGTASSVTYTANKTLNLKQFVIVYEAINQSIDVTLHYNGTSKTLNNQTSPYTLPATGEYTVDACNGNWLFEGWYGSEYESTTAPTYITEMTSTGSAYAIYSHTETIGGGAPTSTTTDNVFQNGTFANSTITWTLPNIVTIKQEQNGAQTAPNNSYINDPRWYADNKITITPYVNITTITVTTQSGYGKALYNAAYSNATVVYNGTTVTITPIIGTDPIEIVIDDQARLNNLTVTYKSGGSTSTTIYTSSPQCATEPTYSVTLQSGLSCVTNGSATVELNATELTNFTAATRTGFTCSGYWSAPSGGVKVLNADGTFAATSVQDYITDGKWTNEGNVTLTPRWVCSNTMTLSVGTQSGGTCSLSKTSLETCDCTDNKRQVTITATPNSGYSVTDISYSGDGTVTKVSGPTVKGENTEWVYQFDQGDNGNGTFTVTFTTIPTYTITWMANGQEFHKQQDATHGTDLAVPSAPDPETYACDDKVFVGWTATQISGTTNDEPDDLFTTKTAKVQNAANTYYAVFATAEGDGGSAGETTTVAFGDQVVIIQIDDEKTELTGFNKTITDNNNYGTYAPYSTTPSATLVWTVEEGASDGTFAFKNGNYYLNLGDNDNHLSCSTTKNTSSSWTVTENNDRAIVTNVEHNSRKIMWNQGSPRFASYAKNHGLNSNQYYYHIKFYKLTGGTSYSGYVTTCCKQPRTPLTITADQIELVKSGVVTLTATGGNGTDITWIATGGVLSNQSNTGATLTISDVDATQNITVTATQTENNNEDEVVYCAQEASIDITVKAQWTITFQTNDNGVINSTSIIVTDGESYTMPDISDEYVCNSGSSFAGWVDNENDTELDATPNSTQTATANQTWYAAWSSSSTTKSVDIYQLVTNVTNLAAGDKVWITNTTPTVAMGVQNDNNRGQVTVTKHPTESDKIYSTGSPATLTIGKDGTNYTFHDGTGYLYAASSSKNYLRRQATNNDNGKWSITIEDGKATITAQGTNTHNKLKYNSSSSIFSCYESGQGDVRIYKNVGTAEIEVSGASITTNNTSCHRGAVISAENGKWITSSNGQKVRIAINVTARGFESDATLSATSANEHFSVVSITNTTITKNSAFETQMMIEYQPAEANTNENAEITLVAKKGEEVVATRTIDVNGRSLPDEFVIVTLRNDKYYALPANMQSGANQYSGIEVAPNNSLTQIPVAPSITIYTLRSVAEARYEAAGNCVRLVGNSNKCLWGNMANSNTTIQNWTTLSETNGSNYEWLLTTTDGEGYTIANPAHPDYSTGRLLAMSGTQFGLYKSETVFYILPVGCSSMPANVQVSPRRVDATFSWESNANSTTIDVYTNEAMTSGNISKTASSSPFFFNGLKELTQYWYKITPDGNATCAVTGSFTTTGPTIDVVEWKEDQVVIFVDKDENVNPLVIIDGEVEHNTGSTSATDLFFSKYFEAQGTAKLLAIYNGTTNALPLEEITILHRSKDKNTPLSLASFGKTPGWIQPSEEIILYNVDDREEVMDCAEADPTFPSWNNVGNKNLEFSGKGTIRLFRGNTCIDIIGAMNSIEDMNNMDASPIEGSENPEFGDGTGFSTLTGDNYATEDVEEETYALSTNRCLLVRKPSVTSGTNAITNNIGDFKTLGNDFPGIANEWAGLQIPTGPSDNKFQYTCEGFKEVGSFDYNKYYKEYTNIDDENYLESYAHNNETHEYTIDIKDLAQYSCLNIRFQLKQGDQILTEAPVQVPIIVNGNKTTADAIFNQIVEDNIAMSIERCATCNVVVLNNATLTKATYGTPNDVPTIGNLRVYPGGSVIVPDGTTYTINSLALRRQEDEIAMANIQGTLNIKQTKSVYLDVRIDPTNWHYISLPHDCRVGDIFFTDGTPAILNTDYLLGWYDGAYRAEHKTGGWTYITDNDYILKRGLGYIIALPGTDKIKRELRFPMANETITEDKGDKEIGGLYAYGGDKSDQELGPNHKGWNMIGNPYLYTYTADIVKEPLQMGTLSKYGDPWDGSWERTGEARYIVEPIDNGWSGYSQTTITNLKPFTSYFIQVGGKKISDGYTTVTPETEQMIEFRANSVARAGAPRKAQTNTLEDNHPVWYGIELIAPNNEKDNTTLLISNDFTDGYDMMDDLVKMRGDYYQYYNYPVLASRNDEGEMAFNALPDNSAARVGVPLNYYAAVAGTYTITTDGRFDLEEVKSAILYDATTAQECDLLLEDYTFTTAKGNNSDRFTLFVTVERKKAPSIPTGKDNLLTDGQLSLITIDRTLVLSGLTDKADIYVYDMTGKLIIGARSSGDNGIWRTSVPTSGVYFVRVNGKTEAQTIKAVVK